MPSTDSASTDSRIALRDCGSTPTVGSSRISSVGRWSRPMPMLSRRFMPPEYSLLQVLGTVGEPDQLEHLVDPRFAARCRVSPWSRPKSVRFSRRGQLGVDRELLRHQADVPLGLDGPTASSARPATVTVPSSAAIRPATIEIVVVLPAPLGPSRPYVSPRRDPERHPVHRGQVAEPADQRVDHQHVSTSTSGTSSGASTSAMSTSPSRAPTLGTATGRRAGPNVTTSPGSAALPAVSRTRSPAGGGAPGGGWRTRASTRGAGRSRR